MLNQNFKKQVLIFGLILLASSLTFFISSFSHPVVIFLLPGLLLGLALTIPHFDRSRKQLIALTTLPVFLSLLYLFSIGIGLGLGIINNSYSDKTGVVIVGIVSSLFFTLIVDQYYSINNKKMSYIIIVILGITSALFCDYLYIEPHSKELNIGKIIAIWEITIGFGLTVFVKFDWMKIKKI